MFISEKEADIIVKDDRKLTESILHKYKTNQILDDGEYVVLRAEVQRILRETPDDEDMPNLFGHKFKPLNYDVANIITTRLLLQGERKDRPFILNQRKLTHGLLEATRDTPGYKSMSFGGREFLNVDIREVFIEEHELNEYFDCYFMKTSNGSPYKAWFYKDYNGIIRYYTKNPIDHLEGWAFDSIDLYGMLIGKGKVLNHDEEKYLRHIGYNLVRKDQPMNYSPYVSSERNRLLNIKSILSDMNKNSEFQGINNTMYAVLDTLLDEALTRTFEHGHFDEHDKTMFFMSNKELSHRLKSNHADKDIKSSITVINNSINLLAVLGFVRKLSDEDLFRGEDNNTLGKTRKEYAKNGWNQINYYTIEDIPSGYWINKQLEKLDNKKVTINNVTQKRLIRAVGKELTDKIYVLDDLSVKRPEYHYERKEYARKFLMLIRDKGFVTKEGLSGVIPSKNVENRMWTELTNNLPGHSIRKTTKKIREELGIDTTGGMFISYSLIHPNQPVALGVKSPKEVMEELLLKVYEELTEEVMFWYGDIFAEHQRRRKRKKDSELFAEFLRTGIAPAGLLA